MTATIEGSEMVIRIQLNENPATSKSGKTQIVATTSGFTKTGVMVKGKQVSVSINAIVPKD